VEFNINYNPLWKLLIDKNLKNSELRKLANISPSTFYKLKKNENVTTNTLIKICSTLECDLSDIVECMQEENK